MYRVDRNNFYANEKKATVYTPSSASAFLYSILKEHIIDGLILDPCVGQGSLLQPFADNGYEVLGIDIEHQGFHPTIVRNYLISMATSEQLRRNINQHKPKNIRSKKKDREKEGKKRQAQGNAVERLGKNLTGIKAMLNHEQITPFVCFFWGCDFGEDETYVPSKVCMLNEFYQSNHTYVFKKDGNSDYSKFAPVSMYYQEKQWDVDSMFEIMKEIAETAIRRMCEVYIKY